MDRKRILVIDDDAGIREFLKMFFEDREYDTETAGDGEQGWQKYQAGNYELVLCDMLMPRMIGNQVLQKIKAMKPDQKVIMMTGVKEDSMINTAKKLGCEFYLTKPVKLADLESRVAECFEA